MSVNEWVGEMYEKKIWIVKKRFTRVLRFPKTEDI